MVSSPLTATPVLGASSSLKSNIGCHRKSSGVSFRLGSAEYSPFPPVNLARMPLKVLRAAGGQLTSRRCDPASSEDRRELVAVSEMPARAIMAKEPWHAVSIESGTEGCSPAVQLLQSGCCRKRPQCCLCPTALGRRNADVRIATTVIDELARAGRLSGAGQNKSSPSIDGEISDVARTTDSATSAHRSKRARRSRSRTRYGEAQGAPYDLYGPETWATVRT